jgi:hypothetical protein
MARELPELIVAILEGGFTVKIEGAKTMTRKEIVVYDKEKYRDKPTPVVAVAKAAYNDTGFASTVEFENVSGVDPAISSELTDKALVFNGVSSIPQEDDYTHTPKRNVPKLDTLVEFWDDDEGLVGLQMEMDVTTVDGSAEITVPDSRLLTPGQAISGTNIPLGAIILGIITEQNGVITTTKAMLSKKATASGEDAVTLTGANKVGEFMQSEFMAWGNYISMPS